LAGSAKALSRLHDRETFASRGRRETDVEANDRYVPWLSVCEDDGRRELESVPGSKVVDAEKAASHAADGSTSVHPASASERRVRASAVSSGVSSPARSSRAIADSHSTAVPHQTTTSGRFR
jgi:hypothetical protein